MCFPDKITLVPAPLNQNRYQLAQGRQGAASRLHGSRWNESLSVNVCPCFCGRVYICRCSFETNKKGENKRVEKQTCNRGQNLQQPLATDDESPGLFPCQCIWTGTKYMTPWHHCSSSSMLSQCDDEALPR